MKMAFFHTCGQGPGGYKVYTYVPQTPYYPLVFVMCALLTDADDGFSGNL